MSVAQSLETPFERFTQLPTSMSYLGEWVSGTQYFRNDVVISPADGNGYIASIPTAFISVVDPSTDTNNWTNLVTIVNGGVQTVASGNAGITVDNTDPSQPVIANAGVIQTEVDPAGLANISTEQLVLLINKGVISIIPSLGIAKAGDQISSTGLTGITAGTGISIPPFLAGSAALIQNAGVIEPTYLGITNTQTNSLPQLSSWVVSTTLLIPSDSTMSPNVIEYNTTGIIAPINQNNVFQLFLENGSPVDVPAGFSLDFSSWSFEMTFTSNIPKPDVTSNKVFIIYIDSQTATTYQSPFPLIIFSPTTAVGWPNPVTVNGGINSVLIDELRNAGLRRVDGIAIFNRVLSQGGGGQPTYLRVVSVGDVFATFYQINNSI